MRLTESQIKQIVNSSVEARSSGQVHRLTEHQLRRAIRYHIKTGEPIDEGLLDMIKGALGSLVSGFTDAFKDVMGKASDAVKKSNSEIQGAMSKKLGTDFPSVENLNPDANDNDKLALVMYMTGYSQNTGYALENFSSNDLQDVDNPYPTDENPEPSEIPMMTLGHGAGWIAGILKEIEAHIPEARAGNQDLDAATKSGDPIELVNGCLAAIAVLTDTVIPQMQDLAKLADQAPDALAAEIKEREYALEDMSSDLADSAAALESLPDKWEAARDELEEQAEEAEEEEGGEGDEGDEGDEGAEGEEGEGMGAVAFGDGGGEEEPKKEESVFRFKSGQLILTENQLKRLVRRLIIN